jgi:queuine/archaeosine tRNA-ribosyltransferase
MMGLLKIHRNNRKTVLEIRHRILTGKISEHNYYQLIKLIEDVRYAIEDEIYSCIEKEELNAHHFRSITGMIMVLYGIVIEVFIHNWIVN